MHTLAIDIGGTKYTLALFDGEKLVRRDTRPTDRSGGRVWMVEQIVDHAWEWQASGAFDRCGIGFGGPVDWLQQRVVCSTHVPGWEDFPLPEHLENKLQVPVVMDNDANVGALGEAGYGAGVAADPLLYMTLSTGIGGGLSIGGKIVRGADSYAGEIGHLCVRPDGPACLCGSAGCLERLCCGLWLEHDFGQPAIVLMRDAPFVQRYVVDLALGLKAAIMLVNPARIVIGGGIAKAGDRLFEPLRVELQRIIPAWSRARIDVVPAALGDDSVLWGALALVHGRFPDASTRGGE